MQKGQSYCALFPLGDARRLSCRFWSYGTVCTKSKLKLLFILTTKLVYLLYQEPPALRLFCCFSLQIGKCKSDNSEYKKTPCPSVKLSFPQSTNPAKSAKILMAHVMHALKLRKHRSFQHRLASSGIITDCCVYHFKDHILYLIWNQSFITAMIYGTSDALPCQVICFHIGDTITFFKLSRAAVLGRRKKVVISKWSELPDEGLNLCQTFAVWTEFTMVFLAFG